MGDKTTAAFIKSKCAGYKKGNDNSLYECVQEKPLPWDQRFSQSVVRFSEFKPEDFDGKRFNVSIDGRKYFVSKRFVKSLCRKLDFTTSVFKYFSPDEFFARVREVEPQRRFHLTVDESTDTLLGVISDTEKVLPAAQACAIITSDPRVQKINYRDGVLSTQLTLDDSFTVPNDSVYNKELNLTFPVDGLNLPAIHLSVLRQVCTNGMVARVPGFKSQIVVNDRSGTHLERLLRSYSNENGFCELEGRLGQAQCTQASVEELMEIEGLLARYVADHDLCAELIDRLELLAGQPCLRYQTTSLHNIAENRRAMLPVSCSINDLITFCTELSTHHAEILTEPDPFSAPLSKLISSNFKLEGLYRNTGRARELHLKDFDFAPFAPISPDEADADAQADD